MNAHATPRFAAFSLSALVTLVVLFGLNGLAATEYEAAQQIAAARTVQPG